MSWIYLLIASLFEIAWTFSLKFMDVKRIRAIRLQEFFKNGETMQILAPFIGYIVFGLGNILFFSMAMKQIPAAMALALWMGITLIGVKLVEISMFKGAFNLYQFFYMTLIIIGIAGLKRSM